jgi:hypothetical protein
MYKKILVLINYMVNINLLFNINNLYNKALLCKHKINKASVRPLLHRILKVHQDHRANHHKVNHLDQNLHLQLGLNLPLQQDHNLHLQLDHNLQGNLYQIPLHKILLKVIQTIDRFNINNTFIMTL